MDSRQDRPLLDVAGRVAAATGVPALVMAYRVLSERTGTNDDGSHTALIISCGLAIAGQVMLVVRWTTVWTIVARTASHFPIRCGLLGVNLFLCAWLAINILTEWGVIGLILAWGLLLLAGTLFAEGRVAETLGKFVRLSPVSFACVYLLLGFGEVFLRSNPMLVGGGGGGNPALRRMYEGLYKYNSRGHRGPEFSLTPEANTFRIVMLGDSFTFGQGVPEGSPYPEQVERQLNRRSSSHRFEVINAGVSGTDTADQVRCLQETCLAYQPDLVTVQFYLNDLEPRMETEAAAVGGFVDGVLLQPAYCSYAVFFLKHRFERLRDSVGASLKKSEPLRQWLDGIARHIETEDAGWQRFESAVEDFAALGECNKLPIAMILFPHPGRMDDSMRSVHNAVAQRVQTAGIPVIDLLDAFSEVPPGQQTVSPIDHHPSPAVYQRAASRIVQELDDLQLLPK